MKKYQVAVVLVIVLLGGFFYSQNKAGIERVINRNYYQLYGALLPLSTDKETTTILNVPFHRQEHALSCEIATLKMVLGYYGLNVSESELLAKLEFDTKDPRSPQNTWGDADMGFVGNIDGRMPNTGYGVYEDELSRLANQYRIAMAFINTDFNLIMSTLARGKPVIIWGHVASGKDISWQTPDGEKEKAIYGEHTRVLIGFSGTVSNPKYLVLLDPIYGKIFLSKDKFLENWASLDNRSVIVY